MAICLLRCMCRLMMLWTTPPTAQECQRSGRCLKLPRFGGAIHANGHDNWSRKANLRAQMEARRDFAEEEHENDQIGA
jgi:hypothetical protein